MSGTGLQKQLARFFIQKTAAGESQPDISLLVPKIKHEQMFLVSLP